MADRSFGVKEINIIGSSTGVGTPTMESPTNLNLNANRVAISTDVHVGRNINIVGISTVKQLSDYKALVGAASSATETFTVTVASKTSNHRYFGTGSGSGYLIDGRESPFITLLPGKTYRFDQADGSNNTHQLRFYLEADRTTEYTTNVTFNGTAGNAGAYTQITVTDTTPIVLHYQCVNHGYMGNSVQTNSNFINTPHTLFAKQLSVSGVVTATFFYGDGSGLTGITASGSGVIVRDSGTLVGTAGTIDFGDNLTVSAVSAGIVTVTGAAGGGGSIAGINTSGTSTFTNLNVTGVTTSTGGFVGNVTGNATGLTGTPNITVGTVTGNLTGNVTGNATGLSGTPNITVGTISATTTTATSFRSNTTTGDGTDVGFAIKYYITSSGASAYRFAGPGVLNSTNNPTLYLHRGFTYIFENSTGSGHPFAIRTSSGGSAYTSAFLSGSQSGTQIFTVPFDAPNTLVYQCTIHSGMVGTFNIVT